MQREAWLLPLLLLAPLTALAAPAQLYGGALDPVSVGLAVSLGGLALWRTRAAR